MSIKYYTKIRGDDRAFHPYLFFAFLTKLCEALVEISFLQKKFMGYFKKTSLNKKTQYTDNPKIAIIGMGAMGKGLFYQSRITPGIECLAISDIKLERAISCAQWLKSDYRVVRNRDEAESVIGNGMLAICEDGNIVAGCAGIDVVVEASSSIIEAGIFCVTALETKKTLIMMNAEADLIFGPYLLHLAQQHEVVYTSCDGDQHGVIKHLIDDLKFWGFELVMAGNIKGFLDRYSNPTKIIPEADARNLDYKMATAYTDGTKLCIEMALLANGLGLCTNTPGMQGPRADYVQDVFGLFDFAYLWKSKTPFVDYVLGAEPGGGVFVIGYCNNDYQRSMLSYYKMGKGPFYLFYRPYHLCHVEAMSGIMSAVKNKQSLLQPDHGFRTNVYAYAKRDLGSKTVLDGIGGYDCYGLIENYDADNKNPPLPICLAEGVILKRDIRKDEKIYMCDIDNKQTRSDFSAYFKALELSEKIKL
jgi:predicted homoserine dehydrogenase-like protein